MVDGFAVLFAPVDKNGHVLEKAYFSSWHGGRGGGDQFFGGHPAPLAGIHGRGGDMVDALGLVVQKLADR